MNFHDLSMRKIIFFYSLLLKCHILSDIDDLEDVLRIYLKDACSEHGSRIVL